MVDSSVQILEIIKEILKVVNNGYSLAALVILAVLALVYRWLSSKKPGSAPAAVQSKKTNSDSISAQSCKVVDNSASQSHKVSEKSYSNTIIINGKKNELRNINQGGKFNEK